MFATLALAASIYAQPGNRVALTATPGNTLSGWAVEFSTTVPVLMRDNPQITDPNLIYAGERYSIPGSSQPASYAYQASPSDALVNPGSYSGFQGCVIAAESGGNSQVMNASQHYGLYQFSAGTWAEYGGNPADFGDASVSEQNAVFAAAMARGGQFNWAPYDGC